MKRQVPNYGIDIGSLISLVYFIIYFLIFYWFYSILRRMEKTLQDIKKLLENRPQSAS